MDKIKAIIVDDMPLAIASLKADLEDYHDKDIEVIGTAEGVMAAAKLIKSVKPQLVFLDIHMGDGDGFDLLEIIETDNLAVIFTTASKDYAIEAFRVSAIDYLLKPIESKLLEEAIQKTKVFLNDYKNLTEEDLTDSFISLSTQEEIRRVNTNNIIRLEAMGNYTHFYLDDGSKILVTKTLKDYEQLLGDAFLRVHQSHLVKISKIKSYIKTEGGYLEMIEKSRVPVSVRKKAMVMKLLTN